jgi:hypothetical protein
MDTIRKKITTVSVVWGIALLLVLVFGIGLQWI